MKTLLKPIVWILAAGSLLTAGSAFAQQYHKDGWDWHKGPPSAEEKLARISDALDLTDQQSTELLAILLEQESNREALRQRTMELMGPEICAQKMQSEEAILAILDEDQAELFLQLKEEHQIRASRSDRSGRGHDGPDCSGYAGDDS